MRPMWAEVLLAAIGIGVTLGLVYLANINLWPPALAQRYGRERTRHGARDPSASRGRSSSSSSSRWS